MMIAAVLLSATALHAAPKVDRHQHILSADIAAIFNGPAPLPTVAVPDDLARLLRLRGERWNDANALAELYTENAVVLRDFGPNFGWIRGRAEAATTLGMTYGRPFTITPAAYRVDGSAGYIVANLTRGQGTAARRHFGVIHFGIEKGADGVWRIASESFATPAGTQQPYGADALIKDLDAAGIERAVVLSGAAMHAGSITYDDGLGLAKLREENDWVAREVAKYPRRLVGFCSFNPLQDHAFAEIARCKEKGFRGVKLHFMEQGVDFLNPAHVPRIREVFAEINRHGLAIVVHPGNNEMQGRARTKVLFDQILTATPDIVVQLAHLWGGGAWTDGADETLAAYAEMMSSKHPAAKNVWFDMSESAMIAADLGDKRDEVLRIIAARIRQIGPERILYGTDGPGLLGHMAPKAAWEQFRTIVPLTAEELAIVENNVAPYMK
ncbi:MAG TPA: amidohydrolase family protein [Thermoanaerobaculia bacterium]